LNAWDAVRNCSSLKGKKSQGTERAREHEPVDAAYKMNRFTGKVWLIKTYSKPLAQGQMRVLVAREAEVEKTRELGDEDVQAFAMNQQPTPVSTSRRR
jgi:hypothetical protein